MKKLIDEKWIVIVYIAMLGVCIILNSGSISNGLSPDLLINISMFVIVALIFGWAIYCSFRKINHVVAELTIATKKIKSDYENQKSLLWDKYKLDDEFGLFKQGELADIYHSYLSEMRRLETISESGCKCNIADYINQDMIDGKAKKNLLNLIPGAMTGMGILGTFIGLSFGLQNFNTGTSAEIEESIAPLMNGIKVAFHTSIYGMVFSLVFNLVYRNILENAYKSLDEFLDVYSLYVCPDSENEALSKLIDLQKKESEAVVDPILMAVQTMNDNLAAMITLQRKQYESFNTMPETMGDTIGRKIDEIVTPQFTKLNESLDVFASKVSENQMSGMSDLIDKFVSQMNESLADSFVNLAKIIEETCNYQKQNNDYMQDILTRVGNMALEIQQINEVSSKTITSLSEYIQDVENLQSVINQNFMSVNLQLEQNNKIEEKQQEYIASLVEYEKRIGEASEKFSRDMAAQIEVLGKLEKEISESTKQNLDILAAKASEYSNSLADTARQQLQTISGLSDSFRQKILEEVNQVNQQAQAQNNQLADNTKQHMKDISDTAKQEIQSVLNLSSTTADDMNRAAQELGTVSKQLNGQLQQSLQTTFDIFDQELTDISKHLSGTIAEVDSTTGRVPRVVASAYEEMGKSFEQMNKQMQSMVHMLDIMQRNMPRVAEELMKKR